MRKFTILCLVFCFLSGATAEAQDARQEVVAQYYAMWDELYAVANDKCMEEAEAFAGDGVFGLLDAATAARYCEIVEAVYELYPENGYVLYDLYRVYRQAARYDEAETMLTRAEMSDVPAVRLKACMARAGLCRQEGEITRSNEFYQAFFEQYANAFADHEDMNAFFGECDVLYGGMEKQRTLFEEAYDYALYAYASNAYAMNETMNCLRCSEAFLTRSDGLPDTSRRKTMAHLQIELTYDIMREACKEFRALASQFESREAMVQTPLSEENMQFMEYMADMVLPE